MIHAVAQQLSLVGMPKSWVQYLCSRVCLHGGHTTYGDEVIVLMSTGFFFVNIHYFRKFLCNLQVFCAPFHVIFVLLGSTWRQWC